MQEKGIKNNCFSYRDKDYSSLYTILGLDEGINFQFVFFKIFRLLILSVKFLPVVTHFLPLNFLSVQSRSVDDNHNFNMAVGGLLFTF